MHMTQLERLDAISREIESLATEVAVRAKAFGGESGAGPRISLVKQRLKVALDELAAYPASADQITDE
jgi:hypothetical protein